MISALNADYLIDTTMIRSARRISKRIRRPARRLSEVVSQLSQRSLNTSDNTKDTKRRVRFDPSPPKTHEYESARSQISIASLWYSAKDCKAMVMEDLMELVQAGDAQTFHSRGMESLCDQERVNRRGATQRYIKTVVLKTHEEYKKNSRRNLLRQSGKVGSGFADSLRRYSIQVTSSDKDFAYRMACEDEVQARVVYLEEGTVKSATHFAAKSSSSIKARAARASPQVRRSFTTMAA